MNLHSADPPMSNPLWTAANAPRIWRPSNFVFEEDEPRQAAKCDDATFVRVAEAGFTGVWFFCKLYDLMRSSVFPELNRGDADERIAALQAAIERGRKHGVGVSLYFNDPVGLDIDHPFWKTHPNLKGVSKWHQYSLCTSTSEVQEFFRDAVESVFARLKGVAGVFLITACESLTHCWSKSNTRRGDSLPTCPRCREREPADIVLELLHTWADVRRQQAEPFRLLAWNWEWAYWYADPQCEITARLPDGVELLLDMEIGGTRPWQDRTNYIGEYSLGYVGPSQRFLATQSAVSPQRVPIHAKIQINNTLELSTVPNLPVLKTLHAKFSELVRHEVSGFLASWCFGSRFALNTYALRLFLQDPMHFLDEQTFLDHLAREYFGIEQTELVIRAWTQFSEAFEHYPFTVAMLYRGPHNDAPARRLSLHYEGKANGRSYMPDSPGDDLSSCLRPDGVDGEVFTLDEVIGGFTRMCECWKIGLTDYISIETECCNGANEEQHRHRREELSVARMIGIQLRSTLNVFRFYREQMRVMEEKSLTPPCDLPPTPELLEIMRQEISNAECALPLLQVDERLGFNEVSQSYKYNAAMIQNKIDLMRAELQKIS